jgi:hypothetical protein
MKKISNQSDFFIFLLERYAQQKSMFAGDVLQMWQQQGLIEYINAMYEQYHTERIENAIEDIDRKIGMHI